MMKTVIHTEKAPKPAGPYSQAIRANQLVFTAGQLGVHPETGRLVEGGIREQTRQVMENLKMVLAAAGTGFSNVVKTTVFLSDINNVSKFNEIYAEYFPADKPARSTFQVAALPMGGMLEIEMVALAE
jgi:2-iminobutanoate/2-iminopropanoate deaminase